MTKQTHHIDFDKLKDFAHVGVRRAVIFMGLGLNAAHREDFLDYELSKIPSSTGERRFPIEFFPEALPAERVNYFKVEFARWIQDCCLCDLLEHHALFLDKIHLHALVVYRSLGKLAEKDDPEKLHNKFRHEGIPGKHKTLRERFGVVPKHSATIDQLYEARNALTHDFGVVLPKRCDANGNFVLRWPKFNFIGIGNETGKETPLAAMMGERTTEETTIALRVEQRETTYKAGERIEARTEDLEGVFHFFAGWAIPSTLTAFVDFLTANGIRQESANASRV
jgi:hypothetical protein